MNEHASAVLDVYLDTEKHAVAHAVLIEGRWGSGKTHFIQHIYEPRRLERLGRRHVPFLYVSLFGAKSAQDVEMRIFKAACPGEAVAGSIAGTIALGIGEFLQAPKTVKGTLSAISKRAIRRLNEYVFVLDDLERVEPGVIGEVMGLVASFVDTHDRRVILVADEDEIRKRFCDYDWDRRAEKVIGRRAAIEPAFVDVLTNFTEAMPEGRSRNAFREAKGDLLNVIRMSGTRNLRNLAWALHNALRFADVLLSGDDIPSDHVIRTIGIVVATSLWSRSRQIDRAAFENLPELAILIRMDSHGMRSRADGEKDQHADAAREFLEAFEPLRPDTPPVDYRWILNLERSGVLDGSQLLQEVKERFGFGEDRREPSWRTLWHSYDRSRAQVEDAIQRLASELKERRYSGIDEILHAIGLSILMREAGDARLTGGHPIVAYFERYIDDLKEGGRLEPASEEFYEEWNNSGLGIHNRGTDEFKHLERYLTERRAGVSQDKDAGRLEEALRAAGEGRFEDLFQFVRTDEPRLSARPVLLDVDVEMLANLFTSDQKDLFAGARFLAYRYSKIDEHSPIAVELPWARRVVEAIERRVEEWPTPHQQLGLTNFRAIIRQYEEKRDVHLRLRPADSTKEEGI